MGLKLLNRRRWGQAVVALIFVASLHSGLHAQDFVNSELPWHAAVTDAQNKLLPWYGADRNLGYDKVLHLAWDYMEHKAATDPKTGLKVYLINSTYRASDGLGGYWQHNPASVYGQFVDSLLAWYPYSGDTDAIAVVRSMLDYQLAHGTTPADWDWAGVPFATACGNDENYGRCLQDQPHSVYGGIETDKVGELGIGYVLFYEFTGDKKYLDAGIRCADALAKHIRPGDETHTPWPFRVDAKTGKEIGENEYGGMVVAPVRLFAELIRIHQGDVAEYEHSRKLSWDWILKYPVHNNRWTAYFEDVPYIKDNVNQALPTMTAYYILSQPDPAAVDPNWVGDVGHLIDWVKTHFGRGPYFGAWAIDEQGTPPEFYGCCSRAGLASDTSRWGAINAMYSELTKDGQARENAYRSMNYATYFAASDGKIACCGLDFADSYWWDDGYGDYIRNFLWGMGSLPRLAPKGEDHLLHSTSVVRKIEYSKRSLRYTAFDKEGKEVLRLTYAPLHVETTIGPLPLRSDLKERGYTIESLKNGDYIVRIRRTSSTDVRISS